jgi:hypothetical protein
MARRSLGKGGYFGLLLFNLESRFPSETFSVRLLPDKLPTEAMISS